MAVWMGFGPKAAYLGARLTLMALRASISLEMSVSSDHVLLAGDNVPVSADSATRVLARLPKPLLCYAGVRGQVLLVACRPQASLSSDQREWIELDRAGEHDAGGFLGFVDVLHDPGDQSVAIFGRDESLIVPRPVVEQWHRDYAIARVHMRRSDASNSLGSHDTDYLEARRQGAIAILRFSSPQDSPAVVNFESLPFPLSESASATERRTADAQFAAMARMYLRLVPLLCRRDRLGRASSRAEKTLHGRRSLEVERARMWLLIDVVHHHYAGRDAPRDIARIVEASNTACRTAR